MARFFDIKNVLSPLLALVVVAGTGSQALADWSPKAISDAADFNAKAPLFADSNEATIWGSIQMHEDHSPTISKDANTTFALSQFGKPLPVILYIQRDPKTHAIKNAPLVVSLPGIFSSQEDAASKIATGFLMSLGYHVLVLPSPWCGVTLSSLPKSVPGDLGFEISWTLASILQAKKIIGPANIATTNVLGASYGAFLAAAVTATDSTKPVTQRLITGTTTLLSPPLSAAPAFAQIDGMIAQSSSQSGCTGLAMLPVVVNYALAKNDKDLQGDAVRCAPSLVASTFQTELTGAVKALTQLKYLSIPVPASVTFGWYEKVAEPTLGNLYATSEKGQLSYWLAEATRNGFSDFRILSAKDDFLNTEENWADVTQATPELQNAIILLNWGGHLGYLGGTALTPLMQDAFSYLVTSSH